jgi:hypothetical protein
MSYANQSHVDGLKTLPGEVKEHLFTEDDRKAAYNDVRNDSFDSLDRLYFLAGTGKSIQAQRLIGLVSLGDTNLIPEFTESGQLLNYDEFLMHLSKAEHDGVEGRAEAIARMMRLPDGCMNGDGK